MLEDSLALSVHLVRMAMPYKDNNENDNNKNNNSNNNNNNNNNNKELVHGIIP